MSLTERFLNLIYTWRPAFCKPEAFKHAQEHALGCISAFGRKTITNFIILFSRDQKDHSADYRFYNTSKWEPNDLFDPLLFEILKLINNNVLELSADDTRLKKTGKKIPGAAWQIDPLGPPFQVNLMWGMRYLQFSAIIPHDSATNRAPRAIPIRFIHAPSVKKPGKKATKEEMKAYKIESKKNNLSTLFVDSLRAIRARLDQAGFSHVLIRVSVDGSYCNKTCLRANIPNVEIIGRCRKNIKLCLPSSSKGRRFYGEKKFTPEEVRQDEKIKWAKAECYYGGHQREMRYKEVNGVLWQGGSQKRLMRLIVLAPIPYIRGGNRYYRQPAYVLTTDLTTPAEILVQAYLNRWQIEVNFKEEKSVIGVGQAQVWSERSVARQPAFCVAAYAALLLASVLEFQDQHQSEIMRLPKWRKVPARPSCHYLKGLMRKELIENPSLIASLNLSPAAIAAILSKAA